MDKAADSVGHARG